MTQKSLNQLYIDQAVARLEDQREIHGSPFYGRSDAELRAAAEHAVSKKIESHDAQVAAGVEYFTKPAPAPAPENYINIEPIVAKPAQGGAFCAPKEIAPAIWAQLTPVERIGIANQLAAGERPTIPGRHFDTTPSGAAPEKPKPKVEFAGGPWMEAYVTGRDLQINLPRVNIMPQASPDAQRTAKLEAANRALAAKKRGEK